MIIRFLYIVGFLMLVCGISAEVPVIPYPEKVELTGSDFVFDRKTKWVVENDQQALMMKGLFERFRISANYMYHARVGRDISANSVFLKTNSALENEAYTLTVDKRSIRIEASGDAGFFYALQSLIQMLPVDIFSDRLQSDIEWRVKGVKIEDRPRFPYRGFMLDVSRYFMPKENVLQLIDYLAFHKINFLHLHLVDDNGWRLQIRKYPELTDVGAWRVSREDFFSMRANPIQGEPTTTGGYYTQEDIREIVAYAANRQVEVIPEIEMPAHTISSLAAYPHLACPVVEDYIGVIPGIGGPMASVIYCAGSDEVFNFLEDVMDEVVELFPSNYIHIGGDEAWKDNWERCPNCQARIQEEGLRDEETLQGYFINRIDSYLKGKGKKLMGWDELVDSEMPEGATIFGWRGMGLEALKAAELGHPIIMTPAKALYFIRYQGPQWFEPYTYFGNNTLLDVYNYEPTDGMSDVHIQRLEGIQACLWTEFVGSPEEAEYLIFPRLAAFAERAWSMPANTEWEDFLRRLDKTTAIYSLKGLNYSSKSMFNIFHEVRPDNGKLKVTLSNIRPDTDIRYTLDGREPNADSELYTGAFSVAPGQRPRAAAFQYGQMKSDILSLNLQFNLATGKKMDAKYGNGQGDLLVNGLMGSEKMTDGEYVDLYDTDGLFIMDAGEVMEISRVGISLLNNSGANVHLPSSIKIYASQTGDDYRLVGEKMYNESERFSIGIFKSIVWFDVPDLEVRFLKFEIGKSGIAPHGHLREGQITRIALDEVIVQ